VPQALSGQLTEDRDSRRKHKRRRDEGPPNMAHAIHATFMGLGFLFVALSVALFFPGGKFWWFWMLIPAFAMLGKGIAEIVRANQLKSSAQISYAAPPQNLPASNTNELRPPVSSVTEGTTRHLGVNSETRPFQFSNPQKPS
jgi:hypothetical protein